MMQDYVNNNKIKENKYKILRMSLLLGNEGNREETLKDFEDSAREIDAMNDETYLRDLQDKFYDTKKLEDEEKKLEVLVNYIDGRVEQRISLLTDFSNITGFDLQDLPPIKYYDKLDDYKERLSYIKEYLGNVSRLDELNRELKSDNKKLESAYKNKAVNEEFNQRSEDLLFNKFSSIVKSLDYFSDVNDDNIDTLLDEAILNTQDSKKSLDIFTKSFNTLVSSGINPQEKEEYSSYVKDAQKVYYDNKEKEYLFRVYQYLTHRETEYNSLLVKRDCVNDLLYERLNLRQEFGIGGNDLLSGLYDILERQYHDIERQSENVKAIDSLNEKIKKTKEEINDLELDNQKVEILALLREFGIIDTYSEKVDNTANEEVVPEVKEEKEEPEVAPSIFDIPEEKPVVEETVEKEEVEGKVEEPIVSDIFENKEKEEKVEEEPADIFADASDNQIVVVENADNIDLDYVHSKANKVMKRVGEMLGIKPSEEEVVSVVEAAPEVPKEPVFEEVKEEEKKEENINPLFNNDVTITVTNQTEEKKEEVPQIEDSSDFWFPSETPDALEELPDLEVKQEVDSNNFFANPIPDLNFPDLKAEKSGEE